MDFSKDKVIAEFKSSILKRFPDATILLFGSRASGSNLKSSDYDFVVISDEFKGIRGPRRLEKVYESWESYLNADILPYTYNEFDEQSSLFTIARKAKESGIKL